MSRIAVGLGIALGTLLLGSSVARADFPDVKIDAVTLHEPEMVRVRFSLLDARRRQVKSKQLEAVTLMQVPDGGRAESLFILKEDGVEWMDAERAESTEEEPTLEVAADLEEEMAAVIVVPGYADPAHTRGTLGDSIRQGVGLFFKKLGTNTLMNVLWVGDEVQTWVRARGRSGDLTPLTPAIRAQCRAWEQRDREDEATAEETPEEQDPEFAEDEAHCGLAEDTGPLARILKDAGFEGYYPHLFGLEAPLCGPPEHGRSMGGGLRVEQEDKGGGRAVGPSAFEIGLRTLVRDGEPDQQKALVLLGNGRDGYVYPAGECRAYLQRRCREDNQTWRAQRRCMDEGWKRFVVAGQERFRDRVGPWLALAKAAGVRIFSVVHPDAPEEGRDRLELLSWRTGGTVRITDDANEVVDLYNDVVDELNGQHVLTFADPEALPGSKRSYQVKVRAGGSTFISGTYSLSIPAVETSWRGTVSGWKEGAERRLGKRVLLGIGVALGLLLTFVLFRGARGLVRAAVQRGRA